MSCNCTDTYAQKNNAHEYRLTYILDSLRITMESSILTLGNYYEAVESHSGVIITNSTLSKHKAFVRT
jgi:hypothetical protein